MRIKAWFLSNQDSSSRFSYTLALVMWMCPQKPKILLLISRLNPDTKAVAQIITVMLKAMAITAIRMITRAKDCSPSAATFLAIKKE